MIERDGLEKDLDGEMDGWMGIYKDGWMDIYEDERKMRNPNYTRRRYSIVSYLSFSFLFCNMS
tara:strand:+ start:1725 stop:1913 length:189 start_codon:yes stop_codon:yes gene_type:complete